MALFNLLYADNSSPLAEYNSRQKFKITVHKIPVSKLCKKLTRSFRTLKKLTKLQMPQTKFSEIN